MTIVKELRGTVREQDIVTVQRSKFNYFILSLRNSEQFLNFLTTGVDHKF